MAMSRPLLLLMLAGQGACGISPDEKASCSALATEFAARTTKREGERVKDVPRGNMTYFLHVPRTAGITMYMCFLKTALPPSQRCRKSYDSLRAPGFESDGLTTEECRLLASHDDWSILDAGFVPPHAKVLVQWRDPIARIISAYEFAINTASRSIRHNETDLLMKIKQQCDRGMANTWCVWPWSHVIPMMESDMRARLKEDNDTANEMKDRNDTNYWVRRIHPKNGSALDDKPYFTNQFRNETVWELPEGAVEMPPVTAYDNPRVMSLDEFVRHPVVHEVLHNGASYQLLGITNQTTKDGPEAESSPLLRTCVQTEEHAETIEALFSAGEARLRDDVWLPTPNERLEDVYEVIASELGFDLDGNGYGSPTQMVQAEYVQNGKVIKAEEIEWGHNDDLVGSSNEKNMSRSEWQTEKDRNESIRIDQTARKNESVGNMTRECINRTFYDTKRQVRGMQHSLQDRYGRMIYYTSQARKDNIKAETIEYIKQANQLDLRLHKLVHDMFDKRYNDLSAAGRITALPESKTKWDRDARLTEDTVHPFVYPPPGWQFPAQLRPYEPPPPPPPPIEKAHVTFISENAPACKVLWVNPDSGEEVEMTMLEPGMMNSLNSQTMHRFMIRDVKTNEPFGEPLVVPHQPGGSVKFYFGDNPRTVTAADVKKVEEDALDVIRGVGADDVSAVKEDEAAKTKKNDEL